jgi:hypothetical protein
MGLQALEPLEAIEELVGAAVDRAAPKGHRQGAPKPRRLSACLLVPKPWLAPKSGRRTRIGSKLPSIGSLRLNRAPEPRTLAAVVPGSAGFFSLRVRMSVSDGNSPRAPRRSWKGRSGISRLGTLDPET